MNIWTRKPSATELSSLAAEILHDSSFNLRLIFYLFFSDFTNYLDSTYLLFGAISGNRSPSREFLRSINNLL